MEHRGQLEPDRGAQLEHGQRRHHQSDDNTVFISDHPTIANLTLGSGTATDSLTLDNGESLTVAGGAGAGSLAIAAGSTFTLNLDERLTDLILSGTTAPSP